MLLIIILNKKECFVIKKDVVIKITLCTNIDKNIWQ